MAAGATSWCSRPRSLLGGGPGVLDLTPPGQAPSHGSPFPHSRPRQSRLKSAIVPDPIRKEGCSLTPSGSGVHGGGGTWPAQPRRGPVMGLPQRRLLREARADRRGYLRVTPPPIPSALIDLMIFLPVYSPNLPIRFITRPPPPGNCTWRRRRAPTRSSRSRRSAWTTSGKG
jgi:hypothetical protein